MAQTSIKDLFIHDREIKRKHIDIGAVGPDQIESGSIGPNQLANSAILLEKLDKKVKELLLPSASTFYALNNAYAPSSNNPFVTRNEIFSFTFHWKDPVNTFEDLPQKQSGLNKENDVRLVAKERRLYVWQNEAWLPLEGQNNSSESEVQSTSSQNNIDFFVADFELGTNDSIDIEHQSDAEYNRIIQIKEKISGSEYIFDSINFNRENDYIKTSPYTIGDTVVATSSKQILPGSRNIVWNPGIVGLLVEDINGYDYRINSIQVQDGNNLPQLITLETNLKSNYTGTVYIGNAIVNDNSASIIRQKNPSDFLVFSDTNLLTKKVVQTQVLGSKNTGITAVLSLFDDGTVVFNYTLNECEPVWRNYTVNQSPLQIVVSSTLIERLLPISAEKFFAVHMPTSSIDGLDPDIMTNTGSLTKNDMYAIAYIEKGTKKPKLVRWCHNYGTPTFYRETQLDTSLIYEDIHMDIKEIKSISNYWNTSDERSKKFENKYVVAITASIIESDQKTDRIAVWLNDNAGVELNDNWNSVNPIKTNVGVFAENPKIIITPGNLATEMIAELDVSNESRAYRLWIFYRDRVSSLIKSIPVLTPSSNESGFIDSRLDDYNFIAGVKGLFPGDDGTVQEKKLGVNSSPKILFFDSTFEFSCDNKYDFDVALFEDDFEPGLSLQDVDFEERFCHRRGTPVIIASNASNNYEILVQFKTLEYSPTNFSYIQKTNKFGKNLKLKVEKSNTRHVDNLPYGSGKYNSDNLHIFYINSELTDGETPIPYHIHNRYGTWIDENTESAQINKFDHRFKEFSDSLIYLSFTGISTYSFDFNDVGGIEFAAFNPSEDANRGLYFTKQDSKCKFAIWDSILGNVSSGPGPRSGFAYFHYDGFIYIQGGYSANGTIDPSMWRLNVSTNAWELIQAENAPPRVFHSADVVKNIAYEGTLGVQLSDAPLKNPPCYLEDNYNSQIGATEPFDTNAVGVWVKPSVFGAKCSLSNKREVSFNYGTASFSPAFTRGEIVVGAVSGARGEVLGTVDAASGILNLGSVVGEFNGTEGLLVEDLLAATMSSAPVDFKRYLTFYNFSDSQEPNPNIFNKFEFCDVESVENITSTVENYRDSIINFEIYNLTSGAHGTIKNISYPVGTDCNDISVFLEVEGLEGGSRTTFLQNDRITISYPGRPPFDQVVMYGGGTFEGSRTNGYPDDISASVTPPPDFVSIGSGNSGDNQALRDARTVFIGNLTFGGCSSCKFVPAPMAINGSTFAPVPAITGSLVITDYSEDEIGGISPYPNFILSNRSNAYRVKFKYEQNTREQGSPFTFLGRWSQLNPVRSNTGEPIEGITAWRGAKIFHYGGTKPAPFGHNDYPYVESPSMVYFGGFTKSDFEGFYDNSLMIINCNDVNLGWTSLQKDSDIVPPARAGAGIMVVNQRIENPEKDGLSYIDYHKINDLDQEIWVAGGNNKSLENVNYNSASSLDDIWSGKLNYQLRSYGLGTLNSPIPFVSGDVSSDANVSIKVNGGFNGFIVPNGIRTSSNILDSNKIWKATAKLTEVDFSLFNIGDIITGSISGCSARILGGTSEYLLITDIIPGPKKPGYPAGYPDGKLFDFPNAENLLVNNVVVTSVTTTGKLTEIIPVKDANDRYSSFSINDPTDVDYALYGPDDIDGKPDWITEVTYDTILQQYFPDREDIVGNQGNYWPQNNPVLGERRWTILAKVTITIPSGPGTGDWDVFVGVYNNGIYSYVEYFLPSDSQFAFDMAFIELSGGQYNEDPLDPSGKSWFDVGNGTLHIRIRNTVQQPFTSNFFPYVSAVNNVKFVEIVSVSWKDFTTEIGIKPFKSSWAGFVSDYRNPENIGYIGGRTHSTVLTDSVFEWNKPSAFIQNEQGDIYKFSEITGDTNDLWASLKHGKIVKDGPSMKFGEYLDYSVEMNQKYSAWGVAKIITNGVGGDSDLNRKHVANVGFTVTPNDYDSDYPGLGTIRSERLENFNIEFEGQLNFETGKYYVKPALESVIGANFEQILYPLNSSSGNNYGYSVDIDGDYAVVGVPNDAVWSSGSYITNSGSAYVYIKSGNNWILQARLRLGIPIANELFGWSVSIHGDRVAIGAPGSASNAGKVYIFKRTGTAWSQEVTLSDGSSAAGDQFGYSVSINKPTYVGTFINVIIGSPFRDDGGTNTGAVYLFQYNGATWPQKYKFSLLPDSPGVQWNVSTLVSNCQFGYSVNIEEDYFIVGAPKHTNGGTDTGMAYVIKDLSAGFWSSIQITEVQHSDPNPGDMFGVSVGIHNDDIIVGAFNDNGVDTGSAYVFIKNGIAWDQQAKLISPEQETDSGFGRAVDITDNRVIIGSYTSDQDAGNDAGAAFIFNRIGTTWGFEQKLIPSDGKELAQFGYSVAISTSLALAGAIQDDGGALSSGSAYIFGRTGSNWIEQIKLYDFNREISSGLSNFGCAVDIYGDTMVVGASRQNTEDTATDNGLAHVYRKALNGKWYLEQTLVPSATANGYRFGLSVSIYGDTIAVGAPNETISGGFNRGAVYIYTRSGTVWTEQQKLNHGDGVLPSIAADSFFGTSVSVYGNTLAVGAPNNSSNPGKVHLLQRSGVSWTYVSGIGTGIQASDASNNDKFGSSVSLREVQGDDGSVVLVGAYNKNSGAGKVYLYTDPSGAGNWSFAPVETIILPSNPEAGSNFGYSLRLDRDGEWFVVGCPTFNYPSPATNDSGSIYIFKFDGSWTEQIQILPNTPIAFNRFGISVDIDFSNRNIVVGESFNSSLVGYAHIYQFDDITLTWNLISTLTKEDGSTGDNFGSAVATKDGIIAIGAQSGNNGSLILTSSDQGYVLAYELSETASDLNSEDLFQIIDINYHTAENPLNSEYSDDNNVFTRTIGDKVGGEYSPRIESWVFSNEASIDSSLISTIRDDRAIILEHTSAVSAGTVLSLDQFDNIEIFEANTDIQIPNWYFGGIESLLDLLDTQVDPRVSSVRVFGKVTFVKNRTSTTDPDVRSTQLFSVNINEFGVQTDGFTPGTDVLTYNNGVISTNYDMTLDPDSLDLPYITSASFTLDTQLNYSLTISDTLGLKDCSVQVELFYYDNRTGQMKLPIEINNPTTYLDWQDTTIKFLFSFDGRRTWKKYDVYTDLWIAIDPQSVIEQGMSVDDLNNIVSLPYSGWNNSVMATERNIPPIYQGFIEGGTSEITVLVGLNTDEPAHTPSITEIVMNFFSGSYWTPRNFATEESLGILGLNLIKVLAFMEVRMISPTLTRIFNRHPSSLSKIRTFKATFNLKKNI